MYKCERGFVEIVLRFGRSTAGDLLDYDSLEDYYAILETRPKTTVRIAIAVDCKYLMANGSMFSDYREKVVKHYLALLPGFRLEGFKLFQDPEGRRELEQQALEDECREIEYRYQKRLSDDN